MLHYREILREDSESGLCWEACYIFCITRWSHELLFLPSGEDKWEVSPLERLVVTGVRGLIFPEKLNTAVIESAVTLS